MKRTVLFSISVLLLGCLLWVSINNKTGEKISAKGIDALAYKTSDFDEGEKEDGIAEAQRQEFELTKDVHLGYIPKYRLISAFQNLVNQRKINRNSPNNVSGLSWVERGPNTDVTGPSNGNIRAGNGVTSGRVRTVWVDLSDPTYHTVWVGGVDGGLWKTNDISAAPATWTPVNDFLANLAIGSICQDPLGVNKDTMYFGTGEKSFNADAVRGGGIWKSTDHGSTWNLLASTTSFYNVSKILCDASGMVYVSVIGNAKGIQRSSDGGITWTNITPTGLNTNVTDMKLSTTGRLHAVCGYYNGGSAGYRFTDNPATVTLSSWTSPTTAFPNVQYNCELAVAGNSLYALPANSSYQTPQVYKSTDGGDNWIATASSPPASSGTNDLSSGQAWYNMAIAVDPSNTQNVIVGGLNCYRTTDGGVTWTQISTWIGSALSYIHADQQTAVWTGNQVIIGSDGGIFYSSNSGANFTDRNAGLRLKQFYSCAMHPTNFNYFLGGAQDNGVHQLSTAGLGGSIEVTGGDGAFVQIDQDQPQYQFGSYIYNTYRRSTNGGANWTIIDYSTSVGQFINPTDYDNVNNKMYAGGGNNEFIRWEDPQTGSTFTPVAINAFAGSVRSISISSYSNNTVFFGTSSGKIVKVTNANLALPTSSDISGTGMPGSTVSCVAIGTNDNNLIATYSNYGSTKHIWATTTGGGSGGWTNITGNFPDIPVRWAIFYPEDNTKAIIATEMGVYETSNINGSSTVWTQNASFPIVRTDMLKYRKADGTVAAATHGRGLWTTTIPKTIPYVRFASSFESETETTSASNGCRNYKDFIVNLAIDLPPAGDANVTVGIAGGNTAIQGIDFDFTTNGNFASPSTSLIFANGSTTPQPLTVRIYDDAELENTESFSLNFTVGGATNALAAPSGMNYNFTINDNDLAPVFIGASNNFTIGSQSYLLGNTSVGQPFNAKLKSKRNQMLYLASELTSAGFTAGNITNIAYNMAKSSIRPYQNLQIKMGLSTINNLYDVTTNVVATSTVKSLSSYATVDGWNTFALDVPFVWDGTSNLAVEICYDNGAADTADFADVTYGYSDGSTSSQGNLIWQDNINCGSPFTSVLYYILGKKPEIKLQLTGFGNLIDTLGPHTEYIANNGTYYFYDGNNVLNKISSSTANLGCVSSVLSGTGDTWQPLFGGSRSQKVFDINPSANAGASHTIGLYYTTAELGGNDPSLVQIARTSAATFSAANSGNTTIGTTTYSAYGNGYLFTSSFTGFSKFFLINVSSVLPVKLVSFNGSLNKNNITLNWKTSSEHGFGKFEIQKSSDGSSFHTIGEVNGSPNTLSLHNYNFIDGQIDELNYYRLKLVNIDNAFSYSATVFLREPNVAQRISISNNPFHDFITLHFAKLPAEKVSVELTNITGAKLYRATYGSSNDITLNLSSVALSNGVYFLKTIVDGKSFVNRILKQ
ncbi:MAG: T9SS type A sorting domain-containing protein [Ginsengibacter sp.]